MKFLIPHEKRKYAAQTLSHNLQKRMTYDSPDGSINQLDRECV